MNDETTTTTARPPAFGWDVGPSIYGPRGILSAPEKSGTGNIVLRAGKEHGEFVDVDRGTQWLPATSASWEQSVHAVLTPEEARDYALAILEQLDGPRDLCTIAFKGEAHDSAGELLRRIYGYTVEVVPTEGEPFTATVGDLVYPADGGTSIQLRPWISDDGGEPAPAPGDLPVELNIYDDIIRLEVC